MATAKKKLLSVLTPVLNEQDGLKTYFERIEKELLSVPGLDYEVILIDDGSTDSSWEMIQEKSTTDSRYHGISLSRNFGAHIALSAGLQSCRGDAAVILACDLQDPPKVVLEFVQEWQKGANIVWGHRISRQDDLWRIWVSNAFNSLLKKFAMPKNSQFSTGSFFLADRKSIDAYRK
ncbi:MAG: glycosyltransferase family 2 protein, partial [Candidatus Omnitrophica bacterium]|nr:glycosyltransferase family 2 protein [Candidatus Omnitrophota bacterium]